ncbi:phospholipase D family protein [Flexivirga lutea]
MSLAPESRVLLTDALRPPAGHRLDVAVGTSYSLNLSALLLAPLSFALFEMDDAEDMEKVHPVRLLEAARRYAEHTTVFCQAGGIHVPANYTSILTFVEDSVLEVLPPHDDAIFHPKIWALRFVDDAGENLHRVVILSRNMTLDRSWDTALVLDEDDAGTIPAAPAADFVHGLPGLALRTVTQARLAEIQDLARTLTTVQLMPPEPFTGGKLLPIGLTDERVWPFPATADRLVAISPFLTRPALGALAEVSPNRILLSRAESLDLVGARALDGWDVNVLQRPAEVVLGEDDDNTAGTSQADSAALRPDGFRDEHDGLHAKTFVLDLGDRESMVVTGSANLTSETWGTGVEFDAVLTGPTSACGVDAALDGSPGSPGLRQLLQPYEPQTADGVDDAAIASSYVLEDFHQKLAAGQPTIYIATVDQETVDAAFVVDLPSDNPGVTNVWPISLPKDGHAKPLDARITWRMSGKSVTPFIGVETTYGEGEAEVTRRCVLKATLMGAVDDRRSDAVFDILQSKDDVLQYLMFLLGDPSVTEMVGDSDDRDRGGRAFGSGGSGGSAAALFEPLVRAVGRDEDALARVASLVAELRDHERGDGLVPDDFDELWDIVWTVHQEARR